MAQSKKSTGGTRKKTTTTQPADTQESKTQETQGTEDQGQTTEAPTQDVAETQEPTTSEDTQAPEEETQPEPEVEEPEFDGPEELRGLALRLDDYVNSMAPNVPLDSSDIQTNQMKLRSLIDVLLKTRDELFGEAMKLVVGAVRDNRKGVFSERLVFRGFPQMRLARSERQKLETLVSLLLATADANNPSKVKDVVDMNVVFRYVTDNDQQQRLQSYYGM